MPGTRMLLPEPVPEGERTALLSFILLETGAADWPRPAAAAVAAEESIAASHWRNATRAFSST